MALAVTAGACCEELQVRVDTSIASKLQEIEKEMNEMRGGGRKSIIPATFERRVARLETKMEKVQCALNELQKNGSVPSKSNSQRLQDMKRRIIDHTESIHDIAIPDSISIMSIAEMDNLSVDGEPPCL